jgi:lipoprotein-releasing system permease protein
MSEAVADTRPFAPFEWMLALRYLKARRKEGFISVIAGFSFVGILLGVATLIIVMAVMNGFRNQLVDKILGLNGHIVVNRTAGDGDFDNYADIASRIAALPNIAHAAPVVEGQVLVSSQYNTLFGIVRGLDEEGLKSLPIVSGKDRVIAGSLADFDKQDGIAIGSRLAQSLGLTLGDRVTMISPRGASTPFGVMPRTKPYRIAAVFEMGMSEYDRTMLFMPLAESQRYFSKSQGVDAIEIMTTSPDQVEREVAAIKDATGPGYSIQTWRDRNRSFITVLQVEQLVMAIILSLIILVAALNIVSGMMMLVKDKGRDIAVLRTMGATKGAMMRVFLITGASIGVAGTIGGFILGTLFCWRINDIKEFLQWVTGTTLMDPTIYYLTRLPAEMDPFETGLIVCAAFALSVVATIYPSWRAAQLDPVEALRYE